MPAEVRGRHLHKMSFNIFYLRFPRLVGEAYCWQSDHCWSDDLHWSLTAALAEWTHPPATLWDSCLPWKQSLRVLWDVRKAELCKEPVSPQVTASDCSLNTVARPWKGDKEKHENNHSQSQQNILLISFYYYLITCALSKKLFWRLQLFLSGSASSSITVCMSSTFTRSWPLVSSWIYIMLNTHITKRHQRQWWRPNVNTSNQMKREGIVSTYWTLAGLVAVRWCPEHRSTSAAPQYPLAWIRLSSTWKPPSSPCPPSPNSLCSLFPLLPACSLPQAPPASPPKKKKKSGIIKM